MRNKHDMYINYERSYRKRGKRGPKRYTVLLVILLAAALGAVIFYSIKARINIDDPASQAEEEAQAGDRLSSAGQTRQVSKAAGTPTPSAGPGREDEETAEAMSIRIPVKAKGIYVTSSAAGSDFIGSLLELADTTEINAMVTDIKDDNGRIAYNMDSALAREIGAATDTIVDIDAFVASLKKKNIYLIARIVAFKDPFLAEKRQELAVKNPDGSVFRDNNGDGWVNPYNRAVWDYLIDIASQAAAAGFDEIQFDYIRFSTGEGIAEADFGEEAKIKGKEDIIIEFTKYAYDKLKPLGVYVSADVYGTIISSSTDAGLIGQNYAEMAKHLDYICPMIYPSHFGKGNYGVEYPDLEPYKIIRKVLTASKEKLEQIPKGEHRAIVRPWLQDFTAVWIEPHMKYGGDELREQINGVYSVGYDEWLVWNAGCEYSEDGLLAE